MADFCSRFKSYILPDGKEETINKLKDIRQRIIILIFLVGLFFSIITPYLILKRAGVIESDVTPEYDKNIAVLYFNEPITIDYANKIIGKLEQVKHRAVEDGSFVSLLIVASCPGGSPQGSEEIAHYLEDFQKEVMPVNVYVEEICTSGCLYSLCSVKPREGVEYSGFMANKNSIQGSVGVVMPHLVYGPFLNKHGVEHEYLVEGDYKVPIDAWSLASEESKKYLSNNILNPVYVNFRTYVMEQRGLDDETMSKYDSGRVFTAPLVEGIFVDKITYYTKVRSEMKKEVEKKYPESSVGFVVLNQTMSKESIFKSMVNIENVSLQGDYDIKGTPLNMQ